MKVFDAKYLKNKMKEKINKVDLKEINREIRRTNRKFVSISKVLNFLRSVVKRLDTEILIRETNTETLRDHLVKLYEAKDTIEGK